MASPPVTRLRPLHSYQVSPTAGLDDQCSKICDQSAPGYSILQRQSSLTPCPKESICIRAFVKLVPHLVTLEDGETYCIQHGSRGGFVLAQHNNSSNEVGGEGFRDDEDESFSFVRYDDHHNIPTDFSIGEGKALQLHLDEAAEKIQLVTHSNVMPMAALEALGCMLDDIMLNLQPGRDGVRKWTAPSVLNFPAKPRPLPLFAPNDVVRDDIHEKFRDNEPAMLHRWFEQRVKGTPDNTALDYLVCLDSGKRIQYSYKQVDVAASSVSVELMNISANSQRAPVPTSKNIAILMGPCPELYVSYLAALKAGFTFCPIPVDAPVERKDLLINDLKPIAILVNETTQAVASTSNSSAKIDCINVTPYVIDLETTTNGDTLPSISPALTPSQSSQVSSCSSSMTSSTVNHENDVAYIIYTSGTTGMPKGVAVSHISASCTISALSDHYGFSESGRVIVSSSDNRPVRWFQGAAPTFDISIFEIFWTLSTGSTLCCAPREFTLQDPNRVIAMFGADITNITPSFAALLDSTTVPGLMLGGETLNMHALRDFARHDSTFGHRTVKRMLNGIFNGYGPTETAIYCIAQSHVPRDQRGSVIGTPIATCSVLITNERSEIGARSKSLEPMPMGAAGELVITGTQVSMLGYINRPEETSRVFLNDPYWGRCYRTGDRARIVWNSSGQPLVEFLGRISDEQVKLSGRRVELGEIENVLVSKVQDLREILCCIWKQDISSTGSERVVSLVALGKNKEIDFEAVQQQCIKVAQEHLPDYMRPFKILQVDSLPRAVSGKVDRGAAAEYIRAKINDKDGPQQSKRTHRINTKHVKPLSNMRDAKLEKEIIDIVSRIVKGNIGIAWDEVNGVVPFIELGLDSLHLMRLLRELKKKSLDAGFATGSHEYACLQPPLAQLLDPNASIRSVFFPPEHDTDGPSEAELQVQHARSKLVDFATRNTSAVLSQLPLIKEADIEMILPTTCTQSQLVTSFALDKRSYIMRSVRTLEQGISVDALAEAVRVVTDRHPIYRCAMLPIDEDSAPFSQVILTSEAFQQLTSGRTRLTRKKVAIQHLHDTQVWLDKMEESISLESHTLYQIQILEADSESTSDPSSTGLLLITIAHCICDGASLEVLMDDIAREYANMDPIERHDVFEVVLDWASHVSPKTDKFWQDSLEGLEVDNLNALSGSNVKPPQTSNIYDHGMVHHLSDISWQVLESKSRMLHASPLSILQSSWSLLLQLFSEADTEDITFGSVLAGHHPNTHAPTFSVLPCRVTLPKAQTVSQLLESLTQQSRHAQIHRHTSFGVFDTLPYDTALALQAYAPPELNTDNDIDATAPLPWTKVDVQAVRYDFAIFAEVFPTGTSGIPSGRPENITFKLTYRENALSKISASCIVKQFAVLTQIMLGSSPNDAVQGLPSLMPMDLLSIEGTLQPSENHEQLQCQRKRVRTLHHQFEEQAGLTPDRLALSFYTSLDSSPIDLTYAELDARANGLAEVLRDEDTEIIPLCLRRSVELYVAVLAVLKAGSAWCPIDDTSPVQRRTSLIARTNSKVILTTTESFHLVQPCLDHETLHGMRVLLVDEFAKRKNPKRPAPRHTVSSSHELGGEHLAYLLWTSGTTGEPKGVMIQHAAATQAMRDLQVQVGHDEASGQVRTLQLSSYSFDVFVQDLFYTWGLAGAVISGTRELVLGAFVDFIWKARPTHAHLTPSFGASIAVNEIKGSTLQYVTFIGEKLTEDVAEAWTAPGITTCAYNTYGPAENAVVSTMRQFYGKKKDRAKAANVGFPLKHCTAYVVREVTTPHGDTTEWKLVPRYGVGELALGGSQVAKGYLGNEVKTAKAFIQGPSDIEERIYLTGDVVRLNDHGFEFLGRNDDLIKITGIRIELSEISAACATVKDEDINIEHVETLHILRPGIADNGNNKVIVTFISTKKQQQLLDTEKIRAQVFHKAKDLLPAYMVPGHVVVLDTTMPRTASNKVDRKALQEIYKNSNLDTLSETSISQLLGHDRCEAQATWNKEQSHILEVIAQCFKVAVHSLSPEHSLAGLGFSSLQVTKLAWALRRQLMCEVGVIDLLQCQFLGELVDTVIAKSSVTDKTAPQPAEMEPSSTSDGISWLASVEKTLTSQLHGDLRPSDTICISPATPMQESLVVESMLESQAYWSHRIFDLKSFGTIDTDRLKKAWLAATARFEILRTIFIPMTQLQRRSKEESIVTWARSKGIQSSVLRIVRKESDLSWTQLSTEDDQNLASWAEKLQVELAPTTTIKPSWAVTISHGATKMILSMHHALYDNISSNILLRTITKLYTGQALDGNDRFTQFSRGVEVGLLPTISQREEAVSMWNSRLTELRKETGFLNASFPDLTQSRQKQPKGILTTRKHIPSYILKSAASAIAAPTLFQSALGCVLASYLELKAVMFGQTVSQRILHPELSRIMGPAIVTLPAIVRSDARSAHELWSDLSRDSFNIFRSTQHLHPVDIKRMLNEGTGNSHASFPALFVYHPTPEADGNGHNTHHQQLFREVGQALSLNVEHPLALNVFEVDGTIELSGDGCIISQKQLELMLDQVLDQARLMLELPDTPLQQLRNRLSDRMTSISRGAPAGKNVPIDPTETVSLHASKHPEWVAIEEVALKESAGEDSIVTKSITFSELDNLANAIVSRLLSLEIGLLPDDVIALCMDRDIVSLAATVAIFRAGFVYLPVDEDLPLARKQLLIQDARPKLIITTQTNYAHLALDPENSPVTLMIPDGEHCVDDILSWARPPTTIEKRQGGYLLYTSGSTGRPKGVRVSNNSLCQFIDSFSNRLMEHSPDTATLQGTGKYLNLASRAFDPHLTQMFVPWFLGLRTVIGKDRKGMIGSLQQLINELQITHFGSVPSVLTQMRLTPEDVPSVRVVTTGGEKASNELLSTWSQRDDDDHHNDQQHKAVLFNFYGPTEVTIGCLGHAVNCHSNSRNLGLPLKGLDVLLLCPGTGEEQIVARRGEPGELCIAGPQVALGYLDRPIENAKSFVTTSLLGGGDRIMYRTGDVMRMMHDGTLEFLGRADQQVKIRGQRLELDEVVSFLKEAAANEGSLDFAATVIEIGGEDEDEKQQRLVAFIARKPMNLLKEELDAEVELLHNQSQALNLILERLEEKCEAKLPSFMIPTLLWISRIPYQAAAGKIDSKLLSKLASEFFSLQQVSGTDEQTFSSFRQHEAPVLNAKESAIVAAIETAVNHRVNATAGSNVHHLGIDSLSAVHLVSILRKHGFPKLRLIDILSPTCTVGSLAQLSDDESNKDAFTIPYERQAAQENGMDEIQSLSLSDLGPLPSGLVEQQIEAVLPCLPLQSALVARSLLWLNSTSDRDSIEPHEHVPYVARFSYHLSSGTDVPKWKEAVEKVVESEPMLRTCFVQRENDGRIFQVVLRSSPGSIFENHVRPESIVAAIHLQPPVKIAYEGEEKLDTVEVHLMIHHALFDGISVDLFRQRVQQLYRNDAPDVANRNLELLKEVSFHCQPSDIQFQSAERFWQTKLSGVRPCRVDTAKKSENCSDSTVRTVMRLTDNVSELKVRLKSLSEVCGVVISVPAILQLATTLCLAHLTQQNSVVYGSVMSLRPLLTHVAADIDTFIGPCLNTLVQTISFVDKTETLPALAQRLHKLQLEACQDSLPFISVQAIQKWSKSENALFDTLLNINISPLEEQSEDVNRPGSMVPSDTRSKSDMALAIDVDLHPGGEIILTLSSAGALQETQLVEIGQLFNKIVQHSTQNSSKVQDFVSVFRTTMDARMNTQNPMDLAHTQDYPEEDLTEALTGVQHAISQLLRLKPSEIDTSGTTTLYRLGLDSITILPFVKSINKSMNIKLTPDAMIKARTIQGAARLIQHAKGQTNTIDHHDTIQGSKKRSVISKNDTFTGEAYDESLERIGKELLFVATPLQEGMLSASLASVSSAYFYTHTIQLSDYALKKDSSRLDHFFAAIKDTVQSCEILRTRFMFTQQDDAAWVGIVSPNEQSDLVNWKVLEHMDQLGTIELSIHHALYDADSIRSVRRILRQHYQRRLQGQPSPHQKASIHMFRPFARAVALAQTSSVAFWKELMLNYSYTPIEIVDDSLRASSVFHFTFDEQKLSLLQKRCMLLNVTVKAALHLAWVKTLCESVYGQSDIVFGDIVSTGSSLDGSYGSENTIVGPTINTVPMRVKLAESTNILSVADSLTQVQKLNDDARGTNSLASLRAVQTFWRSSYSDHGDVPTDLFQSLFSFDGVVGTADSGGEGYTNPLFETGVTQPRNRADDHDGAPTYDYYPIIVSFCIKNNELHGKLRTKLPVSEAEVLGTQLESAMRHIIFCDPETPAYDNSLSHATAKTSSRSPKIAPKKSVESDIGVQTQTADAVSDIVKSVLGTRFRGKSIGYDTRLIKLGIDSISAIRLSRLLRKQLGLNFSVFNIMKGASVQDIVRSAASDQKRAPSTLQPTSEMQDSKLTNVVASQLGVDENRVQYILPVLAGQRVHLEQWLYNGKRFFEAPWVYLVTADAMSVEKMADCWNKLCQSHDILRTTFAWVKDRQDLVQVTLDRQWDSSRSFAVFQDPSDSIQALIYRCVETGNSKSSNLKNPPVSCSYLGASDGKAIVLRLHHALYDAWSIKMIERDFNKILTHGRIQQEHSPMEETIRQIQVIRDSIIDDSYWRDYLLNAQDTIIRAHKTGDTTSTPTTESRLGPHFKLYFSELASNSPISALPYTRGNTFLSAAIILAYARTLKHFTHCTRPTFGLNHASRALCASDNGQSIDLTLAAIPTMTLTPVSVDLEGEVSTASSQERCLDLVQQHLAQLSRVAQSDSLKRFSPKYNSYLNIIHVNEIDDSTEDGRDSEKALSRFRLGDPLATDYFTTTKASTSTVSTIEELDTSHLCPHRLFFNVLFRPNQVVDVTVTGDEALLDGDGDIIRAMVSHFGLQLTEILDEAQRD